MTQEVVEVKKEVMIIEPKNKGSIVKRKRGGQPLNTNRRIHDKYANPYLRMNDPEVLKRALKYEPWMTFEEIEELEAKLIKELLVRVEWKKRFEEREEVPNKEIGDDVIKILDIMQKVKLFRFRQKP